MDDFGAHSTTGRLEWVAVRRPPGSLAAADPDVWNYSASIDLDRSRAEHAEFVGLLEAAGTQVVLLDADADELPDSVFTYDPSLVTRGGAVLLNMGKALRRPEADLHGAFYAKHGVPILGRIEAPGTIEGGDTLWIDDDTLAVGRGYRTNDDGIDQLSAVMGGIGVDVVPFDLPVYQGRDACLHLMSLVSLCDDDLALVHVPLMPVRFLQLLEDRGYRIVVAPADEFESSFGISCNVLATGPRQIVMVEGAPRTQAALEAAGCDVVTFPGADLCTKTEGGPTCLSRPLRRT